MFGEKHGEVELAVAYTQKLWDAGNSIVTVMFGLAFAVYVALSQSAYVRYLVAKYFWLLFGLAFLGNGSLGASCKKIDEFSPVRR